MLPFRVHLIAPEALFPAFGAWYKAKLDRADDGSAWLRSGPPGGPATHREICTALTAAQLVTLVDRLADLALPDWGQKTPRQKRKWLDGSKEALWARAGVSLSVSDNAGQWDDFAAHRASRGLVALGRG